MSGDDLTTAITGVRPPPDAAVVDAVIDAEVPPDVAPVDGAPPDLAPAIDLETCNGEDDDRDDKVDEGLGGGPGQPICCTVSDDVRCGDGPSNGLLLDPGWTRLGSDALVLTAPVTLGALCGIEAACTHLPACRGALDAPDTLAAGLDLYQLTGVINGWSIASRNPPCYVAGAGPVELGALPDGPLSQRDGRVCGARLLPAALHATVLARFDGRRSCEALCDAQSLAAADAAVEAATGAAGWASGWEWVWPGGGVDGPEATVDLAGCRADVCMTTRNRARDAVDGDIAGQTGFRLVCPVTTGRNPCTANWPPDAVCR